MELKQYDIVLVNLDPAICSEIKKTRPCVIISPIEINDHLLNIVIAPMTTRSKPYPTRIRIKHDGKNGWVVVDQLRTVDKKRVVKLLGILQRNEILNLKAVIKETFVD